MLFVGDDWAQDHHDIEIVDQAGKRLVKKRLPEGLSGLEQLHALIADHLDEEQDDPGDVLICIETDRGPWVQALVAAGYTVYPVNPLQAAIYRKLHSVSGAKSDPGDAHELAEMVRLDRARLHPAAGDSALAAHIQVLTRTHQGMIWSRQRQINALRSMLLEFYPAALLAFGDDLAGRDAMAVLASAPSPLRGRKLTLKQVRTVLTKAGRQRYLDTTATKIVTALQTEQLGARPGVDGAYAAAAAALVAVITAMNVQVELLAKAVGESFGWHPDVEIYLSQPGFGPILGARVLAEAGDDPTRYATAKARRNYSGMSPITETSGKSRVVLARYVRNKRLSDAIYLQAFAAITGSPGARKFYDEHRQRGDTHHQALRALGNKLTGILHGCLKHHQPYNEQKAWADQPQISTAA